MENINIGSKLAELRNGLSLTQDEVATTLGISNKTLSKYENGISEPSLTMLIKISEYYGVSTDYILGINKTKDIKSIDLLKQELSELDFEGTILKTYQTNFELLRTKIQQPLKSPADKKTVIPNALTMPAMVSIKKLLHFNLFIPGTSLIQILIDPLTAL